jgi:hypothetical protein
MSVKGFHIDRNRKTVSTIIFFKAILVWTMPLGGFLIVIGI